MNELPVHKSDLVAFLIWFFTLGMLHRVYAFGIANAIQWWLFYAVWSVIACLLILWGTDTSAGYSKPISLIILVLTGCFLSIFIADIVLTIKNIGKNNNRRAIMLSRINKTQINIYDEL